MATKLKRLVLNPKDPILGFHLTQIQDNIDIGLSQLQNAPFQNGVLVVVLLSSGGADNIINHGLDRVAQGWTIVGKDAQADIWESSTVNNFKSKQIILKASATVTAKLYIF
jgi:hypothetical protein